MKITRLASLGFLITVCWLLPSYPTGATTNDPIGFWRLNEGTGTTVADSSTNANNGSFVNTPVWVTGVQSNAVQFTNSNQKVSIDHKTYYNLTNVITVSAWVKPTAFPTNTVRFFTKGNAFNDGWGLHVDTNLKVFFQMTGTAGNSLSSLSAISTSRWTHIAATFDRTNSKTAKLYINGVLEATGIFSGNMINNADKISIGRIATYFPGRIDEAKLWNKVLSERDIILLGWEFDTDRDRLVDVDESSFGGSITNADTDADGFADGLESIAGFVVTNSASYPAITNTLKAYWTLDETNGTIAVDSTGLGSDGTLANGPIWTNRSVAGNALYFDGNNDHVTCGASGTGSPLAVTSLTFSCWAYVTNTTLQASLIHRKNPSGGDGYTVTWQGTNNQVILQIPGSPDVPVSLSEVTFGAWHHYVFSYNGTSTIRAYLDGVFRSSGSFTNGLVAATNICYLARNGSGGQRFQGILDEVRVYGRAIADGDVLALAWIDTDGDDLLNIQETRLGSNANDADTDGDWVEDGWEVANGFDPTVIEDTDSDTLSDAWEKFYFGSITAYNASGNPDGDGLTNSQEYSGGTDPTDYYNGVLPTLVFVSGNNQSGVTNTVLADPMVLDVQNGGGQSLSNAPVTFTVSAGTQISTNSAGPWYTNLSLRTHSSISVYVLLSSAAGPASATATATSGGAASSATATATALTVQPTCIEEAMRAVQERYERALGVTVTWPNRTYITSGTGTNLSPGAYPTNSFYCADIASNGQSQVVSLIQHIGTKLSTNNFLNHFVVDIDGQSNVLVHSTQPLTGTVAGVTVIGIGDMPVVTNFSCGTSVATLGSLQGYIGKLTALLVSASQIEKQLRGGWAPGPISTPNTCDQQKLVANNLWDAASWTNQNEFSAYMDNPPPISLYEETSEYLQRDNTNAITVVGHDARLSSVRGKVSADLASYAGGGATVYFKVGTMIIGGTILDPDLYTNGVSNVPPVPADETWTTYSSFTATGTWSSALLADQKPQFSTSCTTHPDFQGCPPNICGAYAGMGAGWSIKSQVVVATPLWTNNISGSCHSCSFPIFKIVGPQVVCVGSQITLTAQNGQTNYFWSSGDTNKATVASTAGQTSADMQVAGVSASTYVGDVTISVSNGLGCTATYPITVLGVDLDIANVNEPEEEYPGAVVVRNYDNNNAPRKRITLRKVVSSSWTNNLVLTKSANGSKVDVYTASTGGTKLSFSTNDNVFANSVLPKNLWVEGVTASDSTNDVELTLAPQGTVNCSANDKVRFTVLWVNISGKFSLTDNVANDNAATSNAYLLITAPARTTLGPGQGHYGMIWGTEFVGSVSPINFTNNITLSRICIDCRTYTNSSYLGLQKIGPDNSDPVYLDIDPHSGGSAGVVYDIDTPGLRTDVEVPTNEVRRNRSNFQE